MSGGSINYLCYAEPHEMLECNRILDLEEVEQELLNRGYDDIAKDVRRLIEYCKTANNRISILKEQLDEVFHAVEWYNSADIGAESLIETLEEYRKQ